MLPLAAALAFAGACGGSPSDTRQPDAAQANATAGGPANSQQAATPADLAKLDGEIERLEKQAEKNPADDAARAELAKAYVRRADTLRAQQRLREALLDYQRALRINPDDEEAQGRAADMRAQLGGAQEGEYGEPPPLPISPNVTDGEERPTPTPKKK
jgi:tetratricopeptide (TPR) repeat protein